MKFCLVPSLFRQLIILEQQNNSVVHSFDCFNFIAEVNINVSSAISITSKTGIYLHFRKFRQTVLLCARVQGAGGGGGG